MTQNLFYSDRTWARSRCVATRSKTEGPVFDLDLSLQVVFFLFLRSVSSLTPAGDLNTWPVL